MGFKTNEIVAAMPGLLDIAAAGQTDLGVAADITSNILSGFGLQAKESGRAADVLAKAFTSSNTSLESLGDTMKYAAPIAAAAGFSLEETAAAAGLLGDAGIQGSMAGTALRGVMLRLVNPPEQAAAALKKLGVSVTDAKGEMKSFPQIIKELEQATEGMTDAQKTAIISQIAGQNAASGLLAIMEAGGDTLENFTKELENAGGTAQRIANEQIDNLAGDIELLKSALEYTGIAIYKSFDVPLRNVTKTVTSYVDEIGKTLTAHEDIKASAEQLGMTAEELGYDLSKIPNGLEGAAQVMGEILADMLGKLVKFAPKLLTMAANLIKAFIDGIMDNRKLLAGALVELGKTVITTFLELLPQILELGLVLVQELARGAISALPELINVAQNVILTVVWTIVDSLPAIFEAGLEMLMMLVKGIFEMIPELLDTGLYMMLLLVETILKSIPTIIETAIQIMDGLLEGFVQMIPELLKVALKIIETLIEGLISNVDLLVKSSVEIIEKISQFIIDNLPTIIDAALEIILAIMDGMLDNLDLIIDATITIIIAIAEAIIKMLPELVSTAIKIVLALIDGLLKALPQLISSSIHLITQMIGAILRMVPQLIALGMQLVGEIAIGIIKAIPRIVNAGLTIIKSVITAMKGALKGVVSVGKNIVEGIWEGIKNTTDWLLNKIKGFAKTITQGIKDFFGIKSPSRLFRDEIGENLTLGIGVGIEGGMPELSKEAEKEMAALTNKMKAAVEFESTSIGTKLTAGNIGHSRGSNVVNNNDNGVVQNVTIVNPERTPSENARELRKVGRDLALGYA